jgi:hypothetical protein
MTALNIYSKLCFIYIIDIFIKNFILLTNNTKFLKLFFNLI